MPIKRGGVPLITLAIFAVIAITLQAIFTWTTFDNQIHVTERSRAPFGVATPSGAIIGLADEAKDAGLIAGSKLLAIDGRTDIGPASALEFARQHRPGEALDVEIDNKGRTLTAHVKLRPQSDQPLRFRVWVLSGFLDYLTPWFCLALGFGVALVRPRDPLAWLLLALMMSFSMVGETDAVREVVFSWSAPARAAGCAYQNFWGGTWGLWMLLFGQYFPDRRADARIQRITRWALGAPLLLFTVTAAIVNSLAVNDAGAVAGIQRLLTSLGWAGMALTMVAISTFFINISFTAANAKTPDAKRRMRLLYWGTTAALTPMLFVVIVSLVIRKPISDTPDWILIPTLTVLFLFPLTLAYVIVVEKAMDLRVAIRQGLQYALATRGVRLLTSILMVVLLLTAVRLINDPTVNRPKQILVLGIFALLALRIRLVLDWSRRWIDRRFFREAVKAETVLSELGDKVRSIIGTEPLLETVASSISSTLHVPRVAALIASNGDFATTHALGFGAIDHDVRFSRAGTVAAELARTRRPLRVSFANPEPWAERERELLERLSAELLLPLAVKDRLLGFLSLGPKLSEEPYTATDLQLLESVAAQTGLALENTRLTEAVANEVAQRERLNRELEIAREVQERLFPQSGPQVPGLDYAGACRPASSVGGDYYDFVPIAAGRLGIAIGDISGKGVPAALLMASLQASLRGLAISNPPALGTMMNHLNRLIYDTSPSNRYATFFYGVYDPASREFAYVNGGHNPPMVFRGDEVIRLEDGGPVVGLFGPAQYQQSSIELKAGDSLVFFTDGVSEAMNHAEDEFGEDRMIETVRAANSACARELIDHLMRAADEFASGAPQHDDMTLVVVRVTDVD